MSDEKETTETTETKGAEQAEERQEEATFTQKQLNDLIAKESGKRDDKNPCRIHLEVSTRLPLMLTSSPKAKAGQ